MKSRSYKSLAFLLLGLSMVFSSCFKDLDTIPIDPDEVTSAVVYDNPAAYKQVLAKLYAGLAVSGQEGPAGRPDIGGIDEGFSTYLRQYWKAQELSTDEAVIAWNDGNIHDFHQQDWDANNEFISAMYNRIYYQISLCNEFIRETTEAKLNERGVDQATRDEVNTFRAEARFLRALSYWHALDMFRNVPFVTEEDAVGSFFPEQINKDDLFTYVESELKAVESLLVAPRQNEYGRADQAAAWTVLAKLYLNAEVYTGTAKNRECAEYCAKVIGAGFELEPEYTHLFMADNENSSEIIFPVTFDGVHTRTWGGMTFLVHAAVGGSMNAGEFGIDGGWAGTRTTSAYVNKFPAVGGGSVIVAPNAGNSDSYPKLYLPGGYQGWDPANTNTVVASSGSNNQYEGYLWLPADNLEFKITPAANWDADWGDNGGDGTLDPGGSNIVAPEEGFYKLNVDLDNLTYTLVKTTWGLIGDATPGGWDNDTNMEYDATEGAWVMTVDLIDGKIKFRANDGWDINLGDDGSDALLEYNGADISIAPGTYKIKLYLTKPDYTYSIDRLSFDFRALFYTDGQELEIDDIAQFTQGYAVTKYRNVTSTGAVGSDLTFPDTDFPMFRLADLYLMYAEAVLRDPAAGDLGTALDYVNIVRQRAYKGTAGNISAADLNLDFILDERARELGWECQRRTDLIRFNSFSQSDYVWPWKGGAKNGVSTEAFRNVFPIPSSDLGANPNLKQNDGYL